MMIPILLSDFSFEGEVWRDVPSFPDIIVSNFGRVKLPNSFGVMPTGNIRMYLTKPTYGYIGRANKNAKHKYLHIVNRKFGTLKVHQLVCEAFHGTKPNQKSVVIHIDEDSLNNKPENLKWGTQKENLNCPGFLDYCRSRTGLNSPTVKGKLNQ